MSDETRPLTGTEHRAFRLGRLVASETMPYFMHGLFATRPVAAPGLGTFAVDRHWRLYMDPDLLTGPGAWSAQVVGAVLLHEVGHLLRAHADRADALAQPHSHMAWNLAGDAEINDDLLAAGTPLPEGVVTPNALGCEDGGLAEDYYRHLVDRAGSEAMPDDGSAGCGSGSGSGAVPGEAGAAASEDVEAGLGDAEGDLVRRRVAEAVREHASDRFGGTGRGTVPAGLTRWADDVLAPPVVPWDRVLRASVRRAVADQAGRSDYTYKRPARRRVPGLVKPAMRGPSVRVSIVVDTSGSMSQGDLTAAMSEVKGVLRSSGVAREHVRVVSCDAQAGTVTRVKRTADVSLTGGGGTDMRVGIAAAQQARPQPHVVVVLTDGFTPWPDRPGAARLVCGIVGPRVPAGVPEWATTVLIPSAA